MRFSKLLFVAGAILAYLSPLVIAADSTALNALKEKYIMGQAKVDISAYVAYTNAINALMQQSKSKGDLDAFLVLQNEQKTLTAMPIIPTGEVRSNLVAKIPGYNALITKISIGRGEQLDNLQRQYIVRLDALLKELMLSDRIEEAKSVKAEKDAVILLVIPSATKDEVEPKTDSAPPIVAASTSPSVRKSYVSEVRKFVGFSPREASYRFLVNLSARQAKLKIWASGDISTDSYGEIAFGRSDDTLQTVYNYSPKDFDDCAMILKGKQKPHLYKPYKMTKPLEYDVSSIVTRPGEYEIHFKYTNGKAGLAILRVELMVDSVERGSTQIKETDDHVSDSEIKLTDAEQKTVTLTKPYPASYSGASEDKISLQYAVIELGKQVGLKYDWKGSSQNIEIICRRYVYPQIQNMTFSSAMNDLLNPLGIIYEICEGDSIILKKGNPVSSGQKRIIASHGVDSNKQTNRAVQNKDLPTDKRDDLGGYESTYKNIKSTFDDRMASFKKHNQPSYLESELKQIDGTIAAFSKPEYGSKAGVKELLAKLEVLRQQCRVELDANLNSASSSPSGEVVSPSAGQPREDEIKGKYPDMSFPLAAKLYNAKNDYSKCRTEETGRFLEIRKDLERSLDDSFNKRQKGFMLYKACAEQLISEIKKAEKDVEPVMLVIKKAKRSSSSTNQEQLKTTLAEITSYSGKYPVGSSIQKKIDDARKEVEEIITSQNSKAEYLKNLDEVYEKNKGRWASSADIKDVVVSPDDYEGKVVRLRLQSISCEEGQFQPILNVSSISRLIMEVPRPLKEKAARVDRAVGQYGVVQVTVLCKKPTRYGDYMGIMLDVE